MIFVGAAVIGEEPKSTPEDEPRTPGAASFAPGREGRLKDVTVGDTERNYSLAMHLTPLAGVVLGPMFFLTPLVLWLVRKDRSPFNDDHGREVVNFGLSFLLFFVLFSWTIIIPIVLTVVAVVSIIRGAIAASQGEYFRYPITIRFVS